MSCKWPKQCVHESMSTTNKKHTLWILTILIQNRRRKPKRFAQILIFFCLKEKSSSYGLSIDFHSSNLSVFCWFCGVERHKTYPHSMSLP